MNQNPLSIVFMGTPEFAVPCLEALAAAGHRIAAVVTQPDRPRGRGRRESPPPVKETALRLDLPVIQPGRLRDADTVAALSVLKADLFAVVAYGQILPPSVLALPHLGAVNVHASLLPRYRGPAPIQWAILNREPQTGVTTMMMDTGLDTGNILLAAPTPISTTETAATLHDRLAGMGANLLVETVARIAAGDLIPTPQDHSRATYAPMLTRDHGRIDWTRPAVEIDALIRGLTPWPGAFTFHGDKRWKILGAHPAETTFEALPGTVIPGFADELWIMTGDGALVVERIQAASGKRLTSAEFLRGIRLSPGARLD
jgi:methionyl-tRNA formyltransferase